MTLFLSVDSCAGVFDSQFPFLSARTLLGATRDSLWVGLKVALFETVPTRAYEDVSKWLELDPQEFTGQHGWSNNCLLSPAVSF